MKRLVPIGLAGIALAFAATAASHTAHGSRTAEQTIQLISIKASHTSVDQGRKGPSPGDLDISSSRLLAHGKQVGKSQGFCVLIPPQNAECSYTLKLAQGQIALVAGFGPGMNSTNVALDPIVGGTGAFAGAHGFMEDKEVGEHKTQLTIHLAS